MKKENLDREALLLLKALVETQNLVHAAQSLDMPAATASRTLARLRDLFGDTLFTRCAGGLTPTARALELAAKAQAVLSDMEKLLNAGAACSGLPGLRESALRCSFCSLSGGVRAWDGRF